MTVLNVIRGDQQAYSITLTEGDGSALDLTGLDVTFMAKEHLLDADADAVIVKTDTDGIAVNVDPTTGLAILTLVPDDTELLADADRLYWDLQVDNGLGDVRTPLRGKIVIAGDVTTGSSQTLGTGLTYAETMLAIPDLVLYWRLGEPLGTIAVDELWLHHGTYDGTPTLGATGLVAADTDTAWMGNGTDTSIAGPTIPALAEWSIVLWAKSNGANDDFAGYFSTPGDQIDLVRVLSGTQPGQLFFYDGSFKGSATFTVDTSATLIVLTYSVADGLTTYKNGTLDTNYPSDGRGLLNAAFTIGKLGAARTIDTLDEFAILGRAITALEVAALWDKGS